MRATLRAPVLAATAFSLTAGALSLSAGALSLSAGAPAAAAPATPSGVAAPAPFAETEATRLRPRLAAVEGRGVVLTDRAVYRFQPESEAWTLLTAADGLPAAPLTGFSLTADDLWVFGAGASRTAARFDDWQSHGPPRAAVGTIVFDVEADADYAYAGGEAGAARFDRYVLEWDAIPPPPGGPWGAVGDVAVGGDRVWFALERGVAEYRKATERLRVDSLLGQLAAPRVLALRQTSRHLWAVTDRGLARYDKDLESWTSFAPGVELPDARIHQATLVGEDLWLGTDAGLWRYAAASGIWRRDDTADGMPGERVLGFTRERGLWVLTERACAWYDEASARWIDFTNAVPLLPGEPREIGWIGDALVLLGRGRAAYALRGSEGNPALFAFRARAILAGGPEGALGPDGLPGDAPESERGAAGVPVAEGGARRRFTLDEAGLGYRHSAQGALTLKGGATVYVEDDASRSAGESAFDHLIADTRVDLALHGRMGAERSLHGLYDTTDPNNAAYLLHYRGGRDDRLRAAAAGEVDPQQFETELAPLAGLRGGWLRLEGGRRTADAGRRLATGDVWAGERRVYPGREVFHGRRTVYRLAHRHLVPDSERIRLDRELLRAAVDYTIDWRQGSFTLAEHLLLDDDASIEAAYLYEIAADASPAAIDTSLSPDRLLYAGAVGLSPSDRLFLGFTGASWSPSGESRARSLGAAARYEARGEQSFLRVIPEVAAGGADSTALAASVALRARRRGLELTGRVRRMGAGFATLEDRRTRLGRLSGDSRLSGRWDLAPQWQAIVDWDETRSLLPADSSGRGGGQGREALLGGTLRFLGGNLPQVSLRQTVVRTDSLDVRQEKHVRRAEIEYAPGRLRLAGGRIQRLWLRAFFQRSRRETPGTADSFGNTVRATDQGFLRLNGSAGNPLSWNLAWDERWSYRPQERGAHGLARGQAVDVTLQSRPHAVVDAYLRGEARRDLRWLERGGAGGFEVSRQLLSSTQLYPGYLDRRLRPLSLRADYERSSGEGGLAGEPLPGASRLARRADEASLRRGRRAAAIETRLQIASWLRWIDLVRHERSDEASERPAETHLSSAAEARNRLFENRLELRAPGGLITLRVVTERRRGASEQDTTGLGEAAGAGLAAPARVESDLRVLRLAGEWSQTWGAGLLTYGALETRRARDLRPQPLREWSAQTRAQYRRGRGDLDAGAGLAYRVADSFLPAGGGTGVRRDRRTLALSLSFSVRLVRVLALKLQHQALFERAVETRHTVDLRLSIRA